MKKIFTSLFSLFLLFGAMNAVAAEYPFKVTTDAENPELYAIKSGRDGSLWWTYTPTDGMIALAAYTYDDSQYWYFMETTEGETTYLMLYPYLGEGKAMGYTDTSAGGAKVTAVAPGTEGYDCRWIFDNNNGKAPYGLKTSDGSIYLSNYGGAHNKMGFWTTGPAGDGGTAMYFEAASKYGATLKKIATLSDLYYLQSTAGLLKTVDQFSSNAVEPKEGALANLIDNNYSSFFHSTWSQAINEKHYLQVEVSEPVESFIFYFKKRHNNNNNRPTDLTILGSADGETFAEVANINSGFPTTEDVIDYKSDVISSTTAYKYFRFVINATNNNGLNNGFPFFTFSEFWMFPGDESLFENFYDVQEMAQIALAADEESAFYGELMAIFSALADAYFAGEDYADKKAEFEAIMEKITQESKNKALAAAIAVADPLLAEASEIHAETPALGQYSTAAYNAFEAVVAEAKAIENATQEDIDALNEAIKNFRFAKNMPVFIIGGVIEYAKDKYIYDKSAEIPYFKNLDLADESMLWAFDMTSTEVGVKDSAVVVRNLATGNLFWNSAYIKVTETADADSIDDGQYLFFVDHQTNPVHARQSDSGITTWASNTANSGSAWKFTYVGTTYDIYDVAQASWVNVTNDYMINADLSSEEGWTGAGVDDHGAASHKFLAFYSGWGELEQPTTASLKQQVTLPAGEYRLTGKAYFRQGENPATNPTKSLGYMVAGDNKVLVPGLGSEEAGLNVGNFDTAADAFYNKDLFTCTLEFTLEETTTLSIGYECDFDEMRSWMGLGSMKLERNVTPAAKFNDQYAAYEMLQAEYASLYMLNGVMTRWTAVQESAWALKNDLEEGKKTLRAKLDASMAAMAAMTAEIKAIDNYYNNVFTPMNDLCFNTQENSTPNSEEVYAAFDEVCMLGGFMNLYSNVSTLADLEAIVKAMEAGRREYVLNAVPTEGFTFDYTFLIEGVGNADAGWMKNIDGFVGNFVYKNSAEKDTETLKKTGFIEAWNPDAYKGSISYTATELPNGFYKVSAYAFANGATTFFANGKSTAVETTNMYVQPVVDSVYVYNGKLEFGLNVENANWVGITNIELAFIAPKPVVEVASVTLDQTEVTLEIAGEDCPSVQLVATVAPYDADDMTITWTSSDETVATVDANGVVTSVAPGTATITATTANGVSATCVVTVVYAEGIETIETEENAVIYTITGKSVQGSLKSLERGIYIVNGKKVYVK